MVKRQPSKLATRVRFPLPAPGTRKKTPELLMSPILKLRIARAMSLCAILASTGGALADSKPQCDTIAKDVQASITKEPTKVLMIVEDALVINESCACEIVKTAIAASHANAAMVKQIVQTALAVAPKMAPIIMECSGSTAVEASTETVAKATSGKDAKNVLPESVVPPKETSDSDFSSGPHDIRGVYLMQPGFGGGFANSDTPDDNGGGDNGGKKPHKPRGPRRPIVTPLSPSCACVEP